MAKAKRKAKRAKRAKRVKGPAAILTEKQALANFRSFGR